MATAPNGNIVQVWSGPYRTNSNAISVSELYLAVWDSQGNLVTPARLVDDLSAATLRTSDSTPAIAISPDGRIGVIWHRSVRDSNSDIKENIFFQSLAADGVATTGPVNLTNNTVFGRPSSDPNVPAFSEHSIAAANDGRFVMAWTKQGPVVEHHDMVCGTPLGR